MTDYRVRELERRWAESGDEGVRQRYLGELERLLAGGAREFLPQYVGAGGVWIDDLTNNTAVLDAQGLPAERDVPVYRLYGVRSRGAVRVVTVRGVLEGVRVQGEWVENTRRGVFGRWVLPDAVEFTDTLAALLASVPQFEGQKACRGRVLEFFRTNLTGNELVTATRIVYNPQAPDEAIHRWGYADQMPAVFAPIAGESRDIEAGVGLDAALNALVGRDAEQVVHVYEAITGYRPGLWRRHRTNQQVERAVVLGRGVNDVRFVIDVYYIYYYGRALGWSAQNFSRE